MGIRVIEAFLTSSVLILIVLILRKLCRGKISLCLQYGIWLIVAVKLLLVPAPFLNSPFSILNLINVNTETIKESESMGWVPGTDTNTETTYIFNDEGTDHIYMGEEEIVQTEYPYELEEKSHTFAPMEEMTTDKANGAETFFQNLLSALPFILYVNAFLLAAWMLFYNIKFYRKLRSARVPYEDEKYGKESGNPKIYLVEELKTPCLYGMSIYLPVDVTKDERKLCHILAHETAHYRHKDFIWSFLRLICIALNWYNPLVWIAAAAERQDCELACDETAIKTLGEEERVPYGETLIRLVGEKTPQDVLTISTTMTGSKKDIKARISFIAKKPVTVTYMAVIVGVVLMTAVFCTFTGKVEAAERTERNTVTDEADFKEITEEELTEEFTEEELTEEFTRLTRDNTFSVYVRSISRGTKVIDLFSLPVEVWNHEEAPSAYGGLALAEDCIYHFYNFNPEFGTMEMTEVDFDRFIDGMSWDNTTAVECKVTCKDGLVTDIVAYHTYGGITYSEPVEQRDYYDLHGTDGYELTRTYTADVSEAEGMEEIYVYSGNMGDGDGGYVVIEKTEEDGKAGKILWVEEAHTARDGWNNIYLGKINGKAFLFTLSVDVRDGYGTLAYQAFRLDDEGNPLPYNGAKFMYEMETYHARNFTQWYSSMAVYMNQSVLLLSTQDGVLKTGPATLFDSPSSNHNLPGSNTSYVTVLGSSDTTIPAPEQGGFEWMDLQRMIEESIF